MLRLLLTSIALISLCKSVHAEWILSSTSKLPRKSIKMTIGSYNDTIYILGDWDIINNHPNGKQLIKYDISRDEFIDNGIDALPRKVYGETQYYTQIENILYIIDYTGETLATYNMESDSFDSNYRSIPVTVNMYACLSSRSNYLYIVGGYDLIQDTDLDTVQVLDLTTNNWLNNVPSMLEPRTSPSCIVDESFMLYAIGGYIYTSKTDSYSPIASIERIDTNNIQQNSWSYREPLGAAGYGLRSVLHNNNIYIVGGLTGDSDGWTYFDTVRMIDTATGTLSVSPDRLPYKVSGSAIIIVDNILYAFGGAIGTSAASRFDTWMKYELPSTTSTNDPTVNPSSHPTDNPSQTTTTTNDPTKDPTYNPSSDPIYNPTQTTTTTTSSNPTCNPTSPPTATASQTTVALSVISSTAHLTTSPTNTIFSTNTANTNIPTHLSSIATLTSEKISAAPSNTFPYISTTFYDKEATADDIHLDDDLIGNNKDVLLDTIVIIIYVVSLLLLLLCCYIAIFFYHKKVKNKRKFKIRIPDVVAKKINYRKRTSIISLQEANMNPKANNISQIDTATTAKGATNTHYTTGKNQRIGEKDHELEENDEENMLEIGEKEENIIVVYRQNNINIGNDDEVVMGDDEITSNTTCTSNACTD